VDQLLYEIGTSLADGDWAAAVLLMLLVLLLGEARRRRDLPKLVREDDCLKRCGELKGRLCKLEPEPDEPDAE
jgi:hypothetical protein